MTSSLAEPAWQLESFPVDAVSWLDQNGLHRADLHTATSDTVGNYLELVYGDEAHAFLDDRVDMYPKPVVQDFLVLLHGSPGWREVLERRDIDLVLWERTSAAVPGHGRVVGLAHRLQRPRMGRGLPAGGRPGRNRVTLDVLTRTRGCWTRTKGPILRSDPSFGVVECCVRRGNDFPASQPPIADEDFERLAVVSFWK